MRRRVKVEGVTYIELKCEGFLITQFKQKLNACLLIVQNQYNHTTILAYSTICILKVRWFQENIFSKIPPQEAQIQPDDALLCRLSVLTVRTQPVHTVYRQCIWDDRYGVSGDPFPGSQESYKNIYCSSRKVLIVTDGSQNTDAGSS